MDDIIKKMNLENEKIYITRGIIPCMNFAFSRAEDETFFDKFIKVLKISLLIGIIVYFVLSLLFYVPLYYWSTIPIVSILISAYKHIAIKKLIRGNPHTWFIVSDSGSVPHELAHVKLHKDFLLGKHGKVSIRLNAELDREVEEYLTSLGLQDRKSPILKVMRFVCHLRRKLTYF